MKTDDIKKAIYKEKPIAILRYIKKTGILYEAEIEFGPHPVLFQVPISDLGEAEWKIRMPSQLLLRYLIHEND
jgi:hypothetical protein